jgi:HSP20 family protein
MITTPSKVGGEIKKAKSLPYYYEFFDVRADFGWRPSLDVYETDNHLVIVIELAGMHEEEIQITVTSEQVRLRGNRYRPSEHTVTRLHYMEISFGPFEQALSLPIRVDPDGASSIYRDGFLIIGLPKERTKEISNG